ncbi:hypothetical protein K1719_036950 [Acacia pycnantha]|nr:hypothetical protein K1719_036950 [Acacia pycnantha]
MNKTFFSDVNDTKDTWSILAKVLQKWSVKRKVVPYAGDEKGSRIEVSATHKNLIGKLKDEPREGMVYNFQNFQVLENDDKYRITTETFGKKHEDMEPPITVLVRFARLNRNTGGRNSTIPKELDEIAGKLVIVKLKIKSHNIKHRTSSIGVTQFCADNNLIKKFKYSNQEESTASTGNIRTISQEKVIEDDDNLVSQLTTPPEAYTKRKTLGNDTPIVYEDLGLAEICTPKMSSTKPLKNIKKEK